MLVTFTLDNENFSQLELSQDIEVENFLALVALDNPSFSVIPIDGSLFIVVNGKRWAVNREVLDMKLYEIGVGNNDLIAIMRVPPPSIPSTTPSAFNPPQSSSSAVAGPSSSSRGHISDLIKGIKIPPANAKKQPKQPQTMKEYVEHLSKHTSKEQHQKQSRNFFIQLASPASELVKKRYGDEFPLAIAQFLKEPTNYEAFHTAYIADFENYKRRLALTEDPTSPEGQQMIADIIKREAHKKALENAMAEMPESFIRTHMLYVKMKVNGVETIGFVDSGAAQTIISSEHAEKFNLGAKIDKDHAAIFTGVGGQQATEGRIHSADIEMSGHVFPAPLNVLSRHSDDILIGLDTLKRHGACIDLAKGCLRLGTKGIEVPFLNEKQYVDECRRLGMRANPGLIAEYQNPLPENEVDNAKLAELVQLGYDAPAALKALAEAHNDLAHASEILAHSSSQSSQHLSERSKQDNKPDEPME